MKRTTDTPDWIALIGAVLDGVPNLTGAACSGRPDVFDSAPHSEPSDVTGTRYAAALAVCHDCPCLTQCRAWVDDTPPTKRPSGVVAGRAPAIPSVGRPRTEVA